MLSAVTTDPVEVVKYGLWNQSKPEYGEFVELRDVAVMKSARFTLDKSINGDRPAPGTQLLAVIDGRIWDEARNGTNGPYIASRLKTRVVGFKQLPKAA